jgi:hypothetical protein
MRQAVRDEVYDIAVGLASFMPAEKILEEINKRWARLKELDGEKLISETCMISVLARAFSKKLKDTLHV